MLVRKLVQLHAKLAAVTAAQGSKPCREPYIVTNYFGTHGEVRNRAPGTRKQDTSTRTTLQKITGRAAQANAYEGVEGLGKIKIF